MDEIPQLPEQSKKKERAACITRWVVLIAFCLLQAFNIVRLQTEITQKKIVDACAAWCVYVKWVLIFSIKPVIFRSFGLHLVLPGMPQSGFVVFHTLFFFLAYICDLLPALMALSTFEQYYDWTQPPGRNGTGFYNMPGNGVKALAVQDLLLNWGCVTILVAVFPLMWLMARGGTIVWVLVMVSTSLCTLACLLRLVPTLIQAAWPNTNYATSKSAVYWLHACGIVNGFAGTAFTPVVSEFVAMWFPPKTRTTATGVAFSAYYVSLQTKFSLLL